MTACPHPSLLDSEELRNRIKSASWEVRETARILKNSSVDYL